MRWKHMQIELVNPKEDFHLELYFSNNEKRMVDMKQFLKSDEGLLKQLIEDEQLFSEVYVDEISKAVSWPNGVDLDTGVLYKHSIHVKG